MKLKLRSFAIACALTTPIMLNSCNDGDGWGSSSSGSTVDPSTMASSTLECSSLSVTMTAGAPSVVINSMVFCDNPTITDYGVDPTDPDSGSLSYERGTATVTMTIDGTTVTFNDVAYCYGVEGTNYDLSIGGSSNTDTTDNYNFTMGWGSDADGTYQEGFYMLYTGGSTVCIPESTSITITVKGTTYTGKFIGNTTKTFAIEPSSK